MSEVGDPSKETMLRGFRLMVLGRAADERGTNLQRQGRIGFYVPMNGQEAAQVGCGLALDAQDWILPAYRELGVALARGIPLKTLFDQFFGNSADLLKGRQMPCHYGYRDYRYITASSPIGTQIVLATGIAAASLYKGEKVVSVPFFGDGATSSSDFHAGMNFAGVYKAPVIFFLQNNGWAISLPREKQTRSPTLAEKAEAYGFPGVQVDGNDFAAVYKAVSQARARAVAGEGPTLIEALTFRMGPHSTSDDPTRYRKSEVVASWREKDPIDRLQSELIAKGWLDEAGAEKIHEEAKLEVQSAIDAAEKSPPPDPSTLFDDVFKEPTSLLEEQRREFLEMVSQGVLRP
jgi:2-oxoisovalerate dehydrogenase E1 component alpha subunit